MKLGIIGLTGSGRSTIFGALTGTPPDPARQAETRISTLNVPDERLKALHRMVSPRKVVHARVEFLLPPLQSATGEGKEPPQWAAARDCDALIHVVRNFRGYGIEPPAPADDFRALDQELVLTDLVAVEKRLERLAADRQRGKHVSDEEAALLAQCRQQLENETPLRHSPDLAAAPQLRGFAFLSAKPMLVLFNNDDEEDTLPDIRGSVEKENCMVMRGKLELELAQMSAEDAEEFLAEFHVAASAKDRVIRRSYDLQGLISFFTIGKDEIRAWPIPGGTQAVDAAGVVHSDMKRGFIRAEVVSYPDLTAAGSFAEAKKRGTVRLEGKTYIVRDGDIVTFRFNV